MDSNFKEEIDLLFVYGTLKKGSVTNKHLLENSIFLGNATTQEKKYNLVSCGKYPGVIILPENSPLSGCKIKGELYKVSWGDLMGIDDYESEGSLYERRLEWFVLKETSRKVQAWIYCLLDMNQIMPEEGLPSIITNEQNESEFVLIE